MKALPRLIHRGPAPEEDSRMNDSFRVMRRPRRVRPPAARATAALIATAVLALLAAACSGSPSSTGSGGSSNAGGSAKSQTGIDYARCMRSHGVPKYPDPDSGNELASGLPKVSPRQLGVSSSQYQAAQNDCARLLPNGGQMTQAQSQRDLNAMLRYARCMRSHGVPNWPDPTYDSAAGWGFNLVHVHGFDPNSAQIDNKMNECDRGLPPGIGVPLSRPGRPG
jgi:hypothetical protein